MVAKLRQGGKLLPFYFPEKYLCSNHPIPKAEIYFPGKYVESQWEAHRWGQSPSMHMRLNGPVKDAAGERDTLMDHPTDGIP